jgi:hypothetical protein
LGLIAWLLGNSDLAEMRAGRMDADGEAATRTGRLCGKITTIAFLILFTLGLALDIVLLVGGMKLAGLR